MLIFPRVNKSSNGDGACEGSRVRNRSTRKVCSRRGDRLCVCVCVCVWMYLLPAQQLPVEVTHPVRLVSLSFIVIRPPATPFVFLLSFSLSPFLSLSLSLSLPLRSYLSRLVSPWLRWSIYSHAAANTRGTHARTTHRYTRARERPRGCLSFFFVVGWNEGQARFR